MCCSPWGHKESDTTERLNDRGEQPLCVLCVSLPFPRASDGRWRVSRRVWPPQRGDPRPPQPCRPWSQEPRRRRALRLPRNGVNSTIYCRLLELPFRERAWPSADFLEGIEVQEQAEAAGTPSVPRPRMGPLVRTLWEARYSSWGPEAENDEVHWSPWEEGHGRLTEGEFSVMGDMLGPAQDRQAHCTEHIVSCMDGHRRCPEKGAAAVEGWPRQETARE